MSPRVAVVVPVHDQAAFLPRALGSLRAQTVTDWEAVVVDDGSTDGPDAEGLPLVRHEDNRGLGAALNAGLTATTAPLVAYLPADDAWDADHLERLLATGAPFAVSGVRWRGGAATGGPEGHGVQLVQVLHVRGPRWPERHEVESDDLHLLLWQHLGEPVPTGAVTCTWTDHPQQRHKAVRESYDGGVNVFRRRYRVAQPLRLHSTDSGLTDEPALYERWRDRPRPPADGPRVLLAGELAFNPDRVVALEERGLQLFGCWTGEGLGAHTVGPLPFGGVPDVEDPRDARPDVVHAQLNWRAVRHAHAVRERLPDVPFVWHFKEAPQACVRSGTWPLLVDLVTGADRVLLATQEELDWFALALPGRFDVARAGVLDGDLPKREWFDGEPSPKLSAADGEVHTVCVGRPLGIDADVLVRLARARVHVHLHGQVVDHGPAAGWKAQVEQAQAAVPGYVHVHPRVDPPDWVRVLSRYDAGWLHRFRSSHGGDLRRAVWDDLNAPARIPTYAAAGLPMLLQRSPGSPVAAETLLGPAAVLYDDVDHLVAQLHDGTTLPAAAAALDRDRFTYDAHADELVRVLLSAGG